MSNLTLDQIVVVRAVDVLMTLSSKSLRAIRAGSYKTYSAQVPASALTVLAQAIEAAWPGFLDEMATELAAAESASKQAHALVQEEAR